VKACKLLMPADSPRFLIPMKIGILQFEMEVPASQSLKDKRRVVRSIKDRLHREHMVSVAETGSLEVWNLATMGLSCVSSDGAYLRGVLATIVDKLNAWPDATLRSYAADVIDAEQSLPETDETGSPLWTPAERRDSDDRNVHGEAA
jgi:uncharacterized protein YlxP (DUF503 family)